VFIEEDVEMWSRGWVLVKQGVWILLKDQKDVSGKTMFLLTRNVTKLVGVS
jgi:hypothetical protein